VPGHLVPTRAAIDAAAASEASGQIDTDKDVPLPPPEPPVILPPLPPSSPPRLFVVPRPEPTPLPPRPLFDVLAVPRSTPSPMPSPPPSFTMSVEPLPTGAHLLRRSSGAPLVIFGLVLLAGVLFAIFAVVSSPPRPELPAPVQAIAEPQPSTTPPAMPTMPTPPTTMPTVPKMTTAASATPPDVPETKVTTTRETSAPATEAIAKSASPSRPARTSSSHRHAHASRPAAAVVDERSVKDGRIVDPFAELK
jgi:hypothetical protein